MTESITNASTNCSSADLLSTDGAFTKYDFHLEDPVQRIIIGCVYTLVAVVGFGGNLLVILAVIMCRKLQTRTNAFVVNLAVADFLTCNTAPFTALALFSLNGWPEDVPLTVCAVMGSLFFVGLGGSVMNLAAIAINRYVLITKTKATYCSIYTPKKMAAMLAFTWLYPAVLVSLPYFGFGKWGYSEKYKTCINQEDSLKTQDLYSLVASLAGYPIPLIILLVCYIKIYLHIRGHLKNMKAKGMSIEMIYLSSSKTTIRPQPPKNPQSTRFSKLQVEITKNLFYVICAFVACLAPYAISSMISSSDPAIPWTGMMVIFNSSVNPIIYGAKHPHFKGVLRQMLRCRYHQIPEPSSCLRKIISR
ncbi:melatonin receptor type 1A-like [Acanthaster planci]|uniref:Melatonin receptor type 1A-like n=1 Tax=Acanthaster planci TaxID=133434 RepID=A0A8B7ZGJ3_ACAPL|nr:melatonin receptor type 1A-like [Acanthaster planci]